MNLTKASKPKAEKKTIERIVVTKPAHYKNIDGESVLMPPKKKVVEEKIKVWIVETEYGGNVESHEFRNQDDAKNFYKGF